MVRKGRQNVAKVACSLVSSCEPQLFVIHLLGLMTSMTVVVVVVVSLSVPEVSDSAFYWHGGHGREQHEPDFGETRNHCREPHRGDVRHRRPRPRGRHRGASVRRLSNRLWFLCPAAHPREQSVSHLNAIISSNPRRLPKLWRRRAAENSFFFIEKLTRSTPTSKQRLH